MLSWNEIESRALKFSKRWREEEDEAAEAKSFLNEFFAVFGVDRKRVATFEQKVPMGNGRNGYIDLMWKGVILIEMKSRGKSLDRAYKQAKDYAFNLEDEELPELIMVCDFENIRLYNLNTSQRWEFKTKDLHKRVKLFSILAGYKVKREETENIEVNIKASEKMAKLHDKLKEHGYEGKNLEVYLVRLLFCLFADDTGIFEKNLFYDYILNSKEDGSDLSSRIARLFEVLDMPPEERNKRNLLSEELKKFRYINGKLFRKVLPFADFDSSMRKLLLECSQFDWGYISPAIFGAMFQGVMNQRERRELGAHYTSEENILKVIRPLFLDKLYEEFEKCKTNKKSLEQFHNKLAKLQFLDPACGCGNFLIITYRELRKLELEVLKMLFDQQQLIIDINLYCKVTVEQFYGIEYEEFACQIAQVGMWLIDHQMNIKVAEHFGLYYVRLPLKQSATIVHGNAIEINWNEVVTKNNLNYIIGNPPFVGARLMNAEQKKDMDNLFKKEKGINNLDYVSAWYKKAAEYINLSNIKCAFVSTNSIVQGEQVPILWNNLINKHNIHIDFAYKTFVWNNEAKGNAKVHCVIIGFSTGFTCDNKYIYNGKDKIKVENINGYLIDAPNIFISSRTKPLCNIPDMCFGNMANDDGNLILTKEEKDLLIEKYPQSKEFIKLFIGATEYINRKERYCIWLNKVSPKEYRNITEIMDRINKVREFRLNSKRSATKKLADYPMLFGEIRQGDGTYILIPRHSSQKRKYIPIGFMPERIIASDAVMIIPNANLYHFGILTSSMHMSWVKCIAGRIKSDYRYSAKVVYNNFPWPNSDDKHKKLIIKYAHEVIEARKIYKGTSLAELYDPLSMPPELVKAHRKLDSAVESAYGKHFGTDEERAAFLMKMYGELVNEIKPKDYDTGTASLQKL